MVRTWVLGAIALTLTIGPARASNASGAATGRLIDQIALDPDACYRVIDVKFSKDDLHVYLTSGYLAFAKPVNGRRVAAAFSTDVDAGDAEVLLIPPDRGERLSLANFTGSPTLDEHFKTSIMLFTDATGEELLAEVKSKGSVKNLEMGALFADRWSETLRNMASSFEVRLVYDLLAPRPRTGLFYMGVGGSRLGNFDIVYDASARQQMTMGQLVERDNRSFFDTWTSFNGVKRRQNTSAESEPDLPFTLDNYRIEAHVRPDLTVLCVTRATATPKSSLGRALPFWISRQMRIDSARVDGEPAEVFQRESLRATLIGGNDNEQFIIVAPNDLDPSKPHEIEFQHEGAVIAKAGEHVFFVSARGTWYPRMGDTFARYDLTFRYPGDLLLVATGDPVSNKTDGDERVAEFRTTNPIRFAGFNLGAYECVQREQAGYSVNVCANREIEAALKNAPPPPAITENETPEVLRTRRRLPDMSALPTPPNPAARLQAIAGDVSSAVQYMTSLFGPPCLERVTVSPIPGHFGQGFPGLIYLSTLSYLDPAQRPAGMRNSYTQMFFNDALDAHEVAHQWWGNIVLAGGYSDEWIMEALADYSALMYLEKKKGPRALDTVLDVYRNHLLEKTENGGTVESSGPITWGVRLMSSHSPAAWRTITYEKGAWIIHMIRRRLGDEQFTAMLRQLCTEYRYRTLTTGQLREMAQRFAPPKSPDADFRQFFDTWVYGSGIPSVKLTHAARASKITGTITAAESDDFSGLIPVEVQQARQRSVYWLQASSDGAPYAIALRSSAAGAKISVDTADVLIKK